MYAVSVIGESCAGPPCHGGSLIGIEIRERTVVYEIRDEGIDAVFGDDISELYDAFERESV